MAFLESMIKYNKKRKIISNFNSYIIIYDDYDLLQPYIQTKNVRFSYKLKQR